MTLPNRWKLELIYCANMIEARKIRPSSIALYLDVQAASARRARLPELATLITETAMLVQERRWQQAKDRIAKGVN